MTAESKNITLLVTRDNAGATRNAINKLLNAAVWGHESRYVYASGLFNGEFTWHRIYAVRVKTGILQGKAISTGEWFTIYNWETR